MHRRVLRALVVLAFVGCGSAAPPASPGPVAPMPEGFERPATAAPPRARPSLPADACQEPLYVAIAPPKVRSGAGIPDDADMQAILSSAVKDSLRDVDRVAPRDEDAVAARREVAAAGGRGVQIHIDVELSMVDGEMVLGERLQLTAYPRGALVGDVATRGRADSHVADIAAWHDLARAVTEQLMGDLMGKLAARIPCR